MVIFAVLALFAGNTMGARMLLQSPLICAGAQGETLFHSSFDACRLKLLSSSSLHFILLAPCVLLMCVQNYLPGCRC